MNNVPLSARRCRCQRPVLDDESCLLCGRQLILLPEPGAVRRSTARTQEWTRAGVIRALKAFTFFRGRSPVRSDWSGRMGDDWPGLETVQSLFGSVEAAVRVAGVEGSPS